MDLSFHTAEGCLNCRAAALLLRDGRLLIMQDEGSDHWYLPGGRIRLNETAEAAAVREMAEELGIRGRILRPLWLNQAFFTWGSEKERYHELCVYFLAEDADGALAARGERFTRVENGRLSTFAWTPIENLAGMNFYPAFLKEEIFRLPEHMQLRTSVD